MTLDFTHFERGLVPSFAGPQSPLLSPDCLLSAEHARHAPSQASLQQTPSAQVRPEPHCEVRSQDSPFLRRTMHNPPLQNPLAEQSASTEQVVAHAPDVPEQRAGPHSIGDAVLGRIVHVPLVVAPRATEQASHEPEHAESQHTESAQTPVPHCRLRSHVPPLASSATQTPDELQNAFVAQSLSVAQVVLHVPAVPEQVLSPQPFPEEPLGSGAHVPIEPDWLHDSHAPGHALLQQYPSAQLPLRQSVPSAQVCPCFLRQTPPESHELAPEQVPGSSASITLVHVPTVPARSHF